MIRAFISLTLSIISLMGFSQYNIQLKVGNKTMTANLADNDATKKLVELLSDGSITIEMEDYGGFEKVGQLPQSFPTSNSQITTVVGDIMLYQGNKMVIFYGTNTWSYTQLGKIEGATEDNVRDFLGSGSVTVTVSLFSGSDVEKIMNKRGEKTVYNLDGRVVRTRPLPAGIYVIDGKKVMLGNFYESGH